MMKNEFFEQVQEAELKGATDEELKTLLGRGKGQKGNV